MIHTSSCRPLFLYSAVKSACLPIAWSFEPHRGYTRLGGMMTAVMTASQPDAWYLSQHRHQQLSTAEEMGEFSKSWDFNTR